MKGSAWESSRKGGVTCEIFILRRSLWWPYTGKLRLDKTEYCLFRILEDILSFMKDQQPLFLDFRVSEKEVTVSQVKGGETKILLGTAKMPWRPLL